MCICAATWDFQQCGMCDQQTDQILCLPLEYSTSVKLLTAHHLGFLSFKEGCTGSSESIHVKMPHCWKSHVAAQLASAHTADKSRPKIITLFTCSSRMRMTFVLVINFPLSTFVGFFKIKIGTNGPRREKPCLRWLSTTKAQTSMRIRAVWSAPLSFAYWKVSYLDMHQAKFLFSS